MGEGFEGFKILGGSDSFEKAVTELELSEEETWIDEADGEVASVEEVLQKIRLALETGGGESVERPCGRETGPCCGGRCS